MGRRNTIFKEKHTHRAKEQGQAVNCPVTFPFSLSLSPSLPPSLLSLSPLRIPQRDLQGLTRCRNLVPQMAAGVTLFLTLFVVFCSGLPALPALPPRHPGKGLVGSASGRRRELGRRCQEGAPTRGRLPLWGCTALCPLVSRRTKKSNQGGEEKDIAPISV